MKPHHLYAVVMLLISGCMVAFMVRYLWRAWRHHRRFMRAIAEVDKAAETMKTARSVDQLRARYERTKELLEHADAIRREP